MTVNHRKIARLMINATKDILHKNCESWLNKNHPGTKLNIRIGNGKKTYHKKLSRGNHLIIFGVEMIKDTMESEYNSSRWRHGREILDRKYFNGVIKPDHMMAAAILHEYAHFIQVLKGDRSYKSVHNEKFYEILNRMHDNGHAIRVLNYLNQFDEFKFVKFRTNRVENIGVKYNKNNLSKGMRITFKGKLNIPITGIIERVSKLTITIKTPHTKYRVPYRLIVKSF